ncbi:MAG: serine/threonine-protein kinase [Polyangiaceae bacterium]
MSNLDPAVVDGVDARIGTTLKRKWRIDSLIGVGGMAAVYAATHRNGNRVAVKILHVQLSVDANLRTRFQREGYVANTVNHPGVVRVLDDDKTDDGAAFLVMDLLEGETAADRAARLGGRLPLHDVLKIGEEVLDILAAAHTCGVVHRDIKPENIFITRDRVTRVLDFGIASLQNAATKSAAGLTAGAMGTPAFMPPEQALGRMSEVDALSDVWAVGATLYTLISGRLVHDMNTPNEILVAAATRPAPSIAFFAPETPPAIVEIVDRALKYDKGERWSSARAMHYAIRQAAALLSTSENAFSHPESSAMRLAVAAGSAKGLVTERLDPASLPNLTQGGVVVAPRSSSRARVVAVSAGAGLALLAALGFVVLRHRAPVAPVESTAVIALPPAPELPIAPEVAPFQELAATTASASPSSSAKLLGRPSRGRPPPTPPVEKSWLDRRK